MHAQSKHVFKIKLIIQLCWLSYVGSQACPGVCMVSLPAGITPLKKLTPSPAAVRWRAIPPAGGGISCHPSTPVMGFCLVWVCSGLVHTVIATVSVYVVCSECPAVSRKHCFREDACSLWLLQSSCLSFRPPNLSRRMWNVGSIQCLVLCTLTSRGVHVNCRLFREASLMIERYTELCIAIDH